MRESRAEGGQGEDLKEPDPGPAPDLSSETANSTLVQVLVVLHLTDYDSTLPSPQFPKLIYSSSRTLPHDLVKSPIFMIKGLMSYLFPEMCSFTAKIHSQFYFFRNPVPSIDSNEPWILNHIYFLYQF